MTRLDFRRSRAMERKFNGLLAEAKLEAIRMVMGEQKENKEKKERKKDNALRKKLSN